MWLEEGWGGWGTPFWLMLNQIMYEMKLPPHCAHCDYPCCGMLLLLCSSPSLEVTAKMHCGCCWEKFALFTKSHFFLILQESTLVKCNSPSDEETVSKVWRLVLSKGSELLWGDKSMPSLEVMNSQCCDMMAFEINTMCVWGGKGDHVKPHVYCVNVPCNVHERKLADQKTYNAMAQQKVLYDTWFTKCYNLRTAIQFILQGKGWRDRKSIILSVFFVHLKNSYSQVSFKNLDQHKGGT